MVRVSVWTCTRFRWLRMPSMKKRVGSSGRGCARWVGDHSGRAPEHRVTASSAGGSDVIPSVARKWPAPGTTTADVCRSWARRSVCPTGTYGSSSDRKIVRDPTRSRIPDKSTPSPMKLLRTGSAGSLSTKPETSTRVPSDHGPSCEARWLSTAIQPRLCAITMDSRPGTPSAAETASRQLSRRGAAGSGKAGICAGIPAWFSCLASHPNQ